MAVEIKYSDGYGYPADFYTMGAIIYEMVYGYPPHFNGQPLTFDNTSSGFKELVEAMIKEDPTERLCNYQEIKKSKWLRNMNW